MKIHILLAALINLSGCAHQTSSDSVVLPKGQIKELLHQCSRATPENVDGFWMVPDQIAQRVDRDIDKVSALQSNAGIAVKRPRDYFRQYVGIAISGRQFVYINAIRRGAFGAADLPWKTKAIRICDGGDTSWGALYDPVSGSFSQLAINGLI